MLRAHTSSGAPAVAGTQGPAGPRAGAAPASLRVKHDSCPETYCTCCRLRQRRQARQESTQGGREEGKAARPGRRGGAGCEGKPEKMQAAGPVKRRSKSGKSGGTGISHGAGTGQPVRRAARQAGSRDQKGPGRTGKDMECSHEAGIGRPHPQGRQTSWEQGPEGIRKDREGHGTLPWAVGCTRCVRLHVGLCLSESPNLNSRRLKTHPLNFVRLPDQVRVTAQGSRGISWANKVSPPESPSQ